MQIIGYQRKTGDFTPAGGTAIHYDNVILHVINDAVIEGVVGNTAEQVKLRTDDVPSIFGGITIDHLQDMFCVDVVFSYSLVNGVPKLTSIKCL